MPRNVRLVLSSVWVFMIVFDSIWSDTDEKKMKIAWSDFREKRDV